MYLVTIQVIMPSTTVSMDTKLLESVVESVFTLVAGLVVILTVLKMIAMLVTMVMDIVPMIDMTNLNTEMSLDFELN